MRCIAVVGAVAISLAIAPALAAADDYQRETALKASQDAIGEAIGDYTFRDTRGQSFRLQQLAGKPLVISLIYTSCYHVCPLLTRNLENKVDIAREAFGDDAFAVVTIGFDWRVDTAEQMRIYASSRGIDDPNWYFLSGDEHTIAALAADVGFQFAASAKGFDHLSQTTLVDGRGRVYRQIYGADFAAPAFVEPLKELVFNAPREAGLLEHWVDTLRFFCTVYDPNSGRYLFDYSIFMTIVVGVLCLGAVLYFIVYEWRRSA